MVVSADLISCGWISFSSSLFLSIVACCCSSDGVRCSDKSTFMLGPGFLFLKLCSSREHWSGATVVADLPMAGSEGRRCLLLSPREWRISMHDNNYLSSFSDSAGTIFIIVRASTLGEASLCCERCGDRIVSCAPEGSAERSPFGVDMHVPENSRVLEGIRIKGSGRACTCLRWRFDHVEVS